MTAVVELTRTITDLQIRPFQDSDALTICSWVTNEAELRMVSGDEAEGLTPEILRSWLAKASASLVLVAGPSEEPIGFCTISKCEVASLPPHYIELCHLLVNPRQKYAFVTSRLLTSAKSSARRLGYRFGCARIVPSNRWALSLARYHNGEEFTDKESWAPSGFRWFRLDLSQDIITRA